MQSGLEVMLGGVLRSEGCRLERVNLYPRNGLWGRGKFGGGEAERIFMLRDKNRKNVLLKKLKF